MPGDNLIRGLLLPDLELTHSFFRKDRGTNLLEAKKTSAMEVCPRCATPSKTLYDRRLVRVRDAPIRDKAVTLTVHKRRFFCKPCQKPFTEPIAGVRKGCRTTERYKRTRCSSIHGPSQARAAWSRVESFGSVPRSHRLVRPPQGAGAARRVLPRRPAPY